MSYFFYHVVDNSDRIRMGYLEAVDEDAVRNLFQKASVKEIPSISECEKPLFYGSRILYYFELSEHGNTQYGTIEAADEDSAFQMLLQSFPDGSVKAVSNQNIEQLQDRSDVYKKTAAYFQQKEAEVSVPVIVEETATENTSPAKGTVVDFKFRELLLYVGSKLGEIGKDPAYTSIVAELASLIFIQREKATTTLREKYDTLHALMREIALIEDELDPTPLKSDLREAIEKMVPFLQQIEKLETQAAVHTEAEETPKQTVEENPFEKQRKEVIRLHKELEELQQSTNAEQNTVDISLKSVLTAELPKLLKWVCVAGIGIKILSDLIFFAVFNANTSAQSTLHELIVTLSTHTLFTKFLIAITGLYLFFAIYEHYWKKYYIIMLSLLAFLCLIFFLSVTP